MATFIPDTTNTFFQLAADLINQSSRNIFLTGKAGTGKTTFLKYIRDHCHKQLAIVAPTGVAAINAGGVTIHSFFQLPFSPFVPEAAGFSVGDTVVNRHNLVSRLRFNGDKIKMLRQLELLIIDEISMVRCDMMDAIDTVLRHFRKKPYEPFGGVQVLFIGDMFQLPPVIKEPEWKILSAFYDGPYFFNSIVMKANPPLYIEFDKIYRQNEEKFIRVLNQVRNNNLDEEGATVLEGRYQPVLNRTHDDGYIILTTHNEQARQTNMAALNDLPGKAFTYEALVEDDFPSNASPAEEKLVLKQGAQVMFIKNDTSERGRRYFNGKIGTITALEEEKIFVQCDDGPAIEVVREKWENIRYTLNKTSQTLDENVLGSFTQFPLRLAWAITIHKSQGLTFEKVIIDAGEAFAPGQVYVALSRCTSLNGLVLKSRLRSTNMFTDSRIVRFSDNISSSVKLQDELVNARKEYQERLLVSSFDFKPAIHAGTELRQVVAGNAASFNAETKSWLDAMISQLNGLQEIALKFHSWLKEQFSIAGPVESNSALQERTARAAQHFIRETDGVIDELRRSPAITDSKTLAKEYNDAIKDLFGLLSSQCHLLQGLDGNFSCERWHQRKKSFILPPFSINAYAAVAEKRTESPHPLLYSQLKNLRDSICSKRDIPIYLVAGSSTLNEMARYLPQNDVELKKISGFGDAKVEKYGKQFLDIIIAYCDDHDLVSAMDEKPMKQERKSKNGANAKKGATHAETFRQFSEGKTVAEIATNRKLAIQTIEGHLARYVSSGDLKIHDLVNKDKIKLIESALTDFSGTAITPLKQQLGDTISYGEIRLVMAGLGRTLEKSPDQ